MHRMSQRFHVLLTTRQHQRLHAESIRTGLPVAELIRRAVDTTYRPHARPTVRGLELSVGVWRRPDAAVAGRRRGRTLDSREV
jgi:Ribbon-helix-helix domain